MKTGRFYFNRLSAAKFLSLTVMSAVLFFLAGCVVTSVYPYYTEKDLVFEPALMGKWSEPDRTNSTESIRITAPTESIQITAHGTNAYWLTIIDTNRAERVSLHLFRLKQQLFFDWCSTNASLGDSIPVHRLSHVTQLGSTFEWKDLNYGWLSELIEKKPSSIRHTLVDDPDNDSKKLIVLTDDTKNLQRFVLKYLNDTNAWGESARLKKVE